MATWSREVETVSTRACDACTHRQCLNRCRCSSSNSSSDSSSCCILNLNRYASLRSRTRSSSSSNSCSSSLRLTRTCRCAMIWTSLWARVQQAKRRSPNSNQSQSGLPLGCLRLLMRLRLLLRLYQLLQARWLCSSATIVRTRIRASRDNSRRRRTLERISISDADSEMYHDASAFSRILLVLLLYFVLYVDHFRISLIYEEASVTV